MTKSALPEGLTLTEKEFNRLMKFAGENDLTIRGNSSTFVLTNSLDNWWAFLLLAEWRGEALEKLTPKYLTVQELIDAPDGIRAQNDRGDRFLKSMFGWVQILKTGEWVSSLISPQDMVRTHRPTYFEG